MTAVVVVPQFIVHNDIIVHNTTPLSDHITPCVHLMVTLHVSLVMANVHVQYSLCLLFMHMCRSRLHLVIHLSTCTELN